MSSTHGIIKLRRGTAAEWVASQPQPDGEILKLGEPGYEKDTRKLKIGDGVTPWNSLSYFGNGAVIDPEELQDLIGDGFLVAGTGINVSYNDGSDSLTISTSGLINNPANNRILTSRDNTTTGIDAESNLTFDNGVLSISGVFPSLKIVDPINGPSLELNGPNSVIFLNANQSHVIDSTGGDVEVNADSGIYLSANYSNYLSISNSGLHYNNTPVSISGHNHTSSNISDFNSSVSGLLPTISNSGDNRILTSDGTSNGIVAESGLSYNSTISNLAVIYDTNVGNSGNSAMLKLDAYDNSNTPNVGARIQFSRYRGTQSSPSGVSTNDVLSVIRTNTPNISGVNSTTSRILVQADGEPSGLNLYTPSRMTFNTSSGPNQLDNSLVLDSDGKLSSNGYLEIIQTNNRLDPALDSGKGNALTVYATPSGLVSPSGGIINSISSNLSPISPNSNHSMFYTSIAGSTYSELPSGVTNSGAIIGGYFGAFRNTRGANVGDPWYDDNGTLAYLYGTIINYGNNVGQSGVGGPAPTGVNPYTENAIGLYIAPQKSYGTINSAYDLFIADTSYNTGTINNHYAIYQIGNRPSYLEGSLSVDNGVSAPTPIYNLGAVSGNTAINYAIDRQIQKLTLNGTAVNFTEGTGWDIANKSVDIILEITVSSTTTVSFDASFVTDRYNPLPTFSSGKYLVLLRSMGTGVVQSHYIGAKTN